MSDLPAQPQSAIPDRKPQVKEYTEAEKALIAASWDRIAAYDPRTEVKIPAYDQLDDESKKRLDEAAKEVVDLISDLTPATNMSPTTLRFFKHPDVYALSFVLRLDTFPDVVDTVIRYSLTDDIKKDIPRLLAALGNLSKVLNEVPNKTLYPYIVDQAIAYIPTHPIKTIGDLSYTPDGFGASAARDTEDQIFGAEA